MFKVKFRKKYFSSILILLFFCIIFFLSWWTDPTPQLQGTLLIYDRHGKLIYQQAGAVVRRKQNVSLDQVPKMLQEAVVLTEDERFWQHLGFDPLAILRASYDNSASGEVRSGASTITQQLIRITVISPYSRAPNTLTRKLQEVLMATRLTFAKTKNQVLETYLNEVHLGHGTYGVEAASRYYFDRTVSGLSISQSALLAGLIANPSAFDPFDFPKQATSRRNKVLQKMLDAGAIDAEQLSISQIEPLPTVAHAQNIVSPHFVQMVISELEKLKLWPSSEGLVVQTTLDSDWQKVVESTATLQIEKIKVDHLASNAGVVVLENKSGKILALLGSVGFEDVQLQGQNNMVLAQRQPGSAFKPLTYAAAFQNGVITPDTLIDDRAKAYLTKSGEGFIPNNYDGRYHGLVSARTALASSYNAPAVEVLSRVSVGKTLEFAKKLGISTLRSVDNYDLALTLGGGEVNLLELTNAYATFARRGQSKRTFFINSVTNSGGAQLYSHVDDVTDRVMDEKTADQINEILSDTTARMPGFGQRSPLETAVQAAVKTGTTTDWHDNWTIGYTPTHTVGVWVGNSDNSPMRRITGVTGAAPIWHEIIELLSANAPNTKFVRPGQETSFQQNITVEDDQDDSLLQIISPKHLSTFEVLPSRLETLSLEVTPYKLVVSVDWYLDHQLLELSECQVSSKTSCQWRATRIGEHTLFAVAHLDNGSKIKLDELKFSVQEYKKEW